MGDVIHTKHFHDAPDHQQGNDKSLADVAWDGFRIFLIEDSAFFSEEFLDFAKDLHEIHAHHNMALRNGVANADMDMVFRVSERQAIIKQAVVEAIKKMPKATFEKYLNEFFCKVCEDIDFLETKHTLFSEHLHEVASDFGGNSSKGLVSASRGITYFAERLEKISIHDIEDAFKRSAYDEVTVFTEEDVYMSLMYDCLAEAMHKSA